MIQVSIVIVCMDNLKNLYPCLNSIKEHTQISFEVFVVAYLFSKENLDSLHSNYPWVQVIESNEIRGFSENNNLALRQAQGKYCFVLNDDTEMRMPVIDQLFNTIEALPKEVAIISPAIYYDDGQIQCCGRPPHTIWTYIKLTLRIWEEQSSPSPYVNQKGVFQSYDVLGAAFLIRTAIFKELGWFDETYFFCPEDIALSTLANKRRYKVFVNADVHLIHYGGLTGRKVSRIRTATAPAATRGSLINYSQNNPFLYFFLGLIVVVISLMKYCAYAFLWRKSKNENYSIFMQINKHILSNVFTTKSCKEIFIKYYFKLKA